MFRMVLRLLILTCTGGFAATVYGAPGNFIYQGQIIKANGVPLSGNPTTFTLQILSPGTEACVLYEEKHMLNMTGSEGVFSLAVGNGSRTGADYEDTSSLVAVFKNNGNFTSVTHCGDGSTTYAPSGLADRRRLRVTYNDGTGDVTLASDHNVQSVPFAWDARTIDGLGPANFVQVNPVSNITQTKMETLFGGSNYATLLGLASGTTPFVGGGANGAAIPGFTADPVSPPAGSMWLNTTTNEMKYNSGSSIEVVGAGGGGGSGDITDVSTTAPLAGGASSGAVALSIAYDNASIGVNGSSQLEVKASGITDAKIDTVGVQKIIGAMGQYLTYQPNGAACIDGEVLKWNTLTGWECGSDLDTNTSAVTTVFGRAGVIAATAGDYTAAQVTNTPAGAVAATTTQAAINELDAEKLALTGGTLTGAVTTTSSVMFNAQNEARYGDSDSSNYAAIRAPSTIASNYVLTLPDTDGNSGEVLTTDGAGVLTWSAAAGGDILGVTTNSGSALTGGDTSGTPVLQVVVDDSSIEISTNALQIKDDGVTTAKILDANVTDAKIADVSVDKITSASGKYFKYMPNAAECTDGGVMKWNATDDQWECGTDTDTNTSAVTTVFGRAGVVTATSGDYTAGQITNVPAGAIAAVTTQAAIDELDAEKLALAGGTLTGAVTTTSTVTFNAQNEVHYADSDSSNYGAIRAPATIASNYVLTLPDTDGNSGEVLTTDGAGVLSWSPASAGDIIGVTTNSGSGLTGGAASGTPVLQVVVDGASIEIATNTIQIKDDGVTTAKILDANVTDAKIASVSVDKISSAVGKYSTYMPNGAECANDGVLKWNNSSDRWECGADNNSPSSGDIDEVIAGTGLTGGATSGAATIAIDFGTGSNQVQQNMDIPHCLSNQKLEMTSGPVYTWSCATDLDSGGDITAVNTTAPLAGGGTTGALTLTIGYDNVTIGMNGSSQLEVKAGGIDTAQIADDAVTTAKILDANVTDAKIADVSVDKITSASGKYFKYMPSAAECADGGVMKWNATDDQWECGTDTDTNTSAVTTVFGRAGVVTATGGDYTAGQITNVPGGAIAAVTTQAAIDELDAEKLALAGGTLTGAVTTTSSVTFNAQNEARYGDSDSSNYAAIRAPASITSNYVLTLPDTDGGAGEVLTTDGAGVLSWTAAAGGDILGVTTNSGSGLTGGAAMGTPVLQVVVDNSSVEIATNTIQIKDGGVTAAKILDANVTDAKIVSMTVDKVSSAASKYFSYMPNAVECSNNGILKWNATDDRWECGSETVSTGDITDVVAGTGLTGGATSGSATLNVDIGTAGTQFQTNSDVDHCTANQKLEMSAGPIYTWSCVNEYTPATLADVDGDTKIQVEESADEDKIRFDTDGSERMIIDETGKVGIGTTNPTTPLQVTSALRENTTLESTDADALPGPYLNLYRNSASPAASDTLGGLQFVGKNSAATGIEYARITGLLASPAAGSERGGIIFHTLGADGLESRLMIASDGKVGIGTDDPQAQLDVSGIIRATEICDEAGSNCKDLSGGWGAGGDIDGITTNTGSALTGGTASGTATISVVTDASTIEVNGSNQLQVKDAGITNAKIVGMAVDKITSASGKYFKYMPNAAECANGGVLKWNSTADQWECGTDTDTNTDAVTTVFGRSGVVAATAGDYTATQITNTPAGGVAAITAQAAINELDTEKLALAGGTLTGAVTTTSSVTFNAQNEAHFADSDSSNYAAIRAPASIGTNYVLTLPDTDGGSGEVLTTDGSGVLSWTAAAAGDILGVTTNSGSGLTGGAATGTPVLQVVVDNSSVEIATNTIQLKDGGVTTAKILDANVTTAKIADANVTNAKIVSMTVDKVTSLASKYFSYMPNAVECANDEILKWDATNDHWICGTQSVGTGDITDVVAGTGLTGGATSGSATLNVNIGTATGQLFTIDAVPHCAPNQKIEITSGPVYTFSCVDEYASISLADADNDTKIQVEESADEDIIRFDTFGTERMIIDKSGNVGIGIAPTQKLHVNGRIETDGGLFLNQGSSGTDNLIYLGADTPGTVNASLGFFAAGIGSSDAAAGAYFLARGNDFNAISSQRGNMFFVAGSPSTPDSFEGSLNFMTGIPETIRLKITNNGRVGVGTASPAASLDIGSKTDAIILPKGTTAQQPTAVNGMLRYNTTNSALEYYNGAWRTVSTGAAGAYLSSTGGTLTGLLTISSGGANVTGGVDNNSGGITEAGSITGVGANITGTAALTVAAGGTNQNLTLNASGTGSTSIGNGGGTGFQVLNNGASTVNYVTVKGAAAGSAPVIGTGGSDTNINLNFTPKGTGNSIFTANNVGIGTTAPAAKLSLARASAPTSINIANEYLHLGGNYQTLNAYHVMGFGYTSPETYPNAYMGFQETSTSGSGKGDLIFGTRAVTSDTVPSERMRIAASGNVGIGTTGPTELLHIVGGGVIINDNNDMGAPVNSGTAPEANRKLSLQASSVTGTSLDFGLDSGYAWIQGRNLTDYSIPYSIALNPNGGKVGIGTTAPAFNLDVVGSSAVRAASSQFRIFETDGADPADAWHMSMNGGALSFIYADDSGGPSYTNAISILPNGNVGIGTTAPDRKFVVNGELAFSYTASASYNGIRTSGITSEYFNLTTSTGANVIHRFTGSSNAAKMVITEGGSVGIGTVAPSYNLHVVGSAGLSSGTAWTNASDIRLKDIQGDYEYGLDEILQLHTVRYNYKKGNALGLPSDFSKTGFIAQEVQKVIPEAVSERKDGFLELNVDPIHWAVVNAVKELYHKWFDDSQSIHRELASVKADSAAKDQKIKALEERLKQQDAEMKNRLDKIERALKAK